MGAFSGSISTFSDTCDSGKFSDKTITKAIYLLGVWQINWKWGQMKFTIYYGSLDGAMIQNLTEAFSFF